MLLDLKGDVFFVYPFFVPTCTVICKKMHKSCYPESKCGVFSLVWVKSKHSSQPWIGRELLFYLAGMAVNLINAQTADH